MLLIIAILLVWFLIIFPLLIAVFIICHLASKIAPIFSPNHPGHTEAFGTLLGVWLALAVRKRL